MDFAGLEKLSLLDFDDNLTATLFTAGCNFMCPFCHNSSLVLKRGSTPVIPWFEILDFLKSRKNLLDAVCITGGEPTLMPDLKDKIKQIKELGFIIKLDTNGTHPEVIKELVDEHLIDYVAMDIKNSPEKYGITAGNRRLNLENINRSVSYLLEGHIPYEFRTTSILEYHEEEDFKKIGEWIKGAKKYFIQRYIDSSDCIAHGLHMIPKEKALEYKAVLEQFVDHVDLRGYD